MRGRMVETMGFGEETLNAVNETHSLLLVNVLRVQISAILEIGRHAAVGEVHVDLLARLHLHQFSGRSVSGDHLAVTVGRGRHGARLGHSHGLGVGVLIDEGRRLAGGSSRNLGMSLKVVKSQGLATADVKILSRLDASRSTTAL